MLVFFNGPTIGRVINNVYNNYDESSWTGKGGVGNENVIVWLLFSAFK